MNLLSAVCTVGLRYIKMKNTESELSISHFNWFLDIGCWGGGGAGGRKKT
jgi:hypothetical protein